MNLIKELRVNGEYFELISDDPQLTIQRPGRAVFTVKSDKPLTGAVSFDIGYKANNLVQFFYGFIEESVTLDKKQQRIICREFGAILQFPLFLNLRHVTIKDILNAISEKTGLNFVVGNGDYSNQVIPYFYSKGDGYYCLDSIGQAFGIELFIWQQEASGNIYVGSWLDSHWREKSLGIDNQWFSNFGAGKRASVPAIPQLKPGAFLNGLGFIESVRLKDSTMALTWGKEL